MKLLFVIYVDCNNILENISSFENNPEISHATEIDKHGGLSISKIIKKRSKNVTHNFPTIRINKIALSSRNDERVQTIN